MIVINTEHTELTRFDNIHGKNFTKKLPVPIHFICIGTGKDKYQIFIIKSSTRNPLHDPFLVM